MRGRERFVGGETGFYSRRAAGFAPNVPHFLGRARPLGEVGNPGVFIRDCGPGLYAPILAVA